MNLSEFPVVAEGKTKKIFAIGTDRVNVRSKDDITAGDGAKHDLIAGKAELATATTSNVFELLRVAGLPVAFFGRTSEIDFEAPRCSMIPFEVVVRGEAHGSFLKRHPAAKKGDVFPEPVVEFFLKTSGKRWKNHELPKDDPLAVVFGDGVNLFLPDQPLAGQAPFLFLPLGPILEPFAPATLEEMGRIARVAFVVLEKAWEAVGGKLVDYKVEFGVSGKGELLLADVIDNDSWRVVENGSYIDKQSYRDGAGLNEVTRLYQRVRDLTNQFAEFAKGNPTYWRSIAEAEIVA